jgi:hypothetical protein
VSNQAEIERLRASVIVNGALIQALLEELPLTVLEAIGKNIEFKFEHFTVRTINSTMPESFLEAQKSSANAWLSQVRDILQKRAHPKA